MEEVLVDLVRAVRRAGLPAGVDASCAFVAAVAELDGTRRSDVRAAGRATLCSSPADLAVFDRVFDDMFRPGHRPEPAEVTAEIDVPEPADEPAGPPDGAPATADGVAATDIEVLRRRDLAEVTPADREIVAALVARLVPAPPMRRGRRPDPHHRGRIDVRASTRAAVRNGGEARLRRSRPRATPRRVVLVLDVSGSMRPYADAYLRFAHACVRALPRVEVFSAGTRLTRITDPLRAADVGFALQGASRAIPDYAGGTRLGDNLATLVDEWGRSGPLRGSVVVIASDGWERGDVTPLGSAAARLRRLARCVIWVHPHRARPGFVAATAGLRAVADSIDALVAGHSVDALDELAQLLGALGSTAPREARRA